MVKLNILNLSLQRSWNTGGNQSTNQRFEGVLDHIRSLPVHFFVILMSNVNEHNLIHHALPSSTEHSRVQSSVVRAHIELIWFGQGPLRKDAR